MHVQKKKKKSGKLQLAVSSDWRKPAVNGYRPKKKKKKEKKKVVLIGYFAYFIIYKVMKYRKILMKYNVYFIFSLVKI